MLVIQDILRSLADDAVRQDFLDGTNGAVKIEQSDMDLLEKLYVEVTPKRPTRSDEPTFTQSATHSANTFSSVIDSRPKPFGESTYDHVKETLQSIQNCGYFEKEIIQVETKQTEAEQENAESVNDVGAEDEKSSETDVNPDAVEAPGASAVPQPEALILQMNQQAPIALQGVQQLPNANILPSVPLAANAPVPVMPVTTVRAVEQNYYKQYMQQPQPTLRPIHEVIGTGNFHFLQDSELDSSDMIMTTAPYPHALPPHPSPQQQQQKLPTTPMVPGIPVNAHPPTVGATPVLSNSTPHVENVGIPIIPSGVQQQQQPQQVQQVNQISLSGGAQPPQSSFPNTGAFPSMAPQATMFNSNVLNKATDQPHIPPFTNVNSPQIPLQVPVGSPQIPGFAMNPPPQNAMAQIAQLQSLIQQQQQLSGSIKVSQPLKQDLVNADDLTEKLKSTLHINDNKSNNVGNSPDNVMKSSQSPLTNHHTDSQDWNDVNNDANSWSNQMAEENNRSDRYKRSSGGGSGNNSNIGGMFRSSDKYGGGNGGTGNSYRPRNTYQNGNRGMQSNNGGDNASSTVFFRNNDRYYQNGTKDNSYNKPAGNGNLGSYNNKPPRTDMMNNRPPRMQSGAPGGEYRPRPGQGRDNRGGLKA